VAYVVFEAVGGAGNPASLELLASPGRELETRVVGTFVSWQAALGMVARLERQARRKPRGSGGFALGIKSDA
jgi:hypothetical protein